MQKNTLQDSFWRKSPRIMIGILAIDLDHAAFTAALLITSGFLCLAFASAHTFEQLALFRFLLGFVGAGFLTDH
jgi:NNP family nitrate/nitrite transporter-like MFS transporter